MTISVVLRLALPALREGRLAGHAEIVSDGTRLVIHDAAELVEAIRRHADAPGPGPEGAIAAAPPPTPGVSSSGDRSGS